MNGLILLMNRRKYKMKDIERYFTICGHGYATPSLKRLDDYCTTRYNQIASNGKHKGVVCVRRHKMMVPDLEKKFKNNYETILGRNKYDQSRRSYVYNKAKDGYYYSDCSSSGMATMRDKCGLKIVDEKGNSWLLNTAAIYNSPSFETVPVEIIDGHIQNPEILNVGDCLLFVGSDPSRPLQIGHVEYIYKIGEKECKLNGTALLYEKKDVLSNHLALAHDADTINLLSDCGDGWSLVIFDHQAGFMKNTAIKNKDKSSYPESKIEQDCWMRELNRSTSAKVVRMHTGDKVKVVTKRKYWSNVITEIDGNKTKGWVKTKFLT